MHCSKQSENLISKSDRSGRGMKYAVLNGALFRSASFHPKWALSLSFECSFMGVLHRIRKTGRLHGWIFNTLRFIAGSTSIKNNSSTTNINFYRIPRVSFRVIYDPLKNCAKIQSNSNSSPFVPRKYSFLVFQAYFKNVSLKIARITVR